MTNYEVGITPAFPLATNVTNFVYIENTISVDEANMMFSVTLDLITVWMDARLAYADSVSTSPSLDVTSFINSIWKPQVQISDNVKDSGKCSLFT